MPDLTPVELGYLRAQKNSAQVDWYLAVAPYGTNNLFSAQVNDASIERGDRVIEYDNESGESDVIPGMTLWVGTIAGARNVGIIRIKEIDTVANEITVAENDHIEWIDDLHLTVPGEAGFFELWAKYQRLINEGGVGFEVFKDYDVDYTNQGDHLPPKANGGPPVCAWIDDSGNADVDFIGIYSLAYEVGEVISTYTWDFADGAIIAGGPNQAGTEAAPNTVRFTTPGFRYVSLTVTDSLGTSSTVYIPVWIFQEGVEEPFKKVELSSLEGGDEGWNARIRIHQTNTAAEEIIKYFPNGALVVLFTRTTYGDTEIGVGGYSDRENIEFVGWLREETLDFDHATGHVEFDAESTDGVLKRLPGFSFPLEDNDSPSNWMELKDLNVDRAMHFLFEYHTTVNKVCHVDRVGEMNDRTMLQQRFPKQSVYEQVNDALLSDAQCQLMSDRQGILRATKDPQFMDSTDRASVPVVCTLTEADWMNRVEEIKRHKPQVGYVKLGGFADDTPYLSAAPGEAPRQNIKEIHDEGYIVKDQDELTEWAALRLTKENVDYPSVPLELCGFWPVFEPALQEYVAITFTDPLSRKVWVDDKFIVRSVSVTQTSGTSLTTIIIEHESRILDGIPLDIPPVQPPDNPPFPPLPPGPSIPPTPGWDSYPKAAVAWTKDQVGWTQLLVPGQTECWPAGIYGSSGAIWFDITPDDLTTDIVDVKVVMEDENTLVAYLLTTYEVYRTDNILSVSDVNWEKKTIRPDFEALMSSGWMDHNNYFFSQAIRWGYPDYLIVGVTHDPLYRYASYPSYDGAFWLTKDGGETWTIATMPTDDGPSTVGGWTNCIPWADSIGVNHTNGNLIAFRNGGIDYHGKHSICTSTDGGETWSVDELTLPDPGSSAQHNQWNVYGACLSAPMSPSNVFFHTKAQYGGTPYMPRLSTDWGASWNRKLPFGYLPGDPFGAAVAMYYPGKIAAVFEDEMSNERRLFLSSDYASSWREMGQASTLFSSDEGGRVFSWPSNQDAWVWVCHEALVHSPWSPRIVYTGNNGTTWCDVTGDWVGVFGDWSGGKNSGIRLLPNIGSNI